MEAGKTSNILVYRLQIEQNFQRIRWYPELVHRIFTKGSTQKDGHTSKQHHNGLTNYEILGPDKGFLWDITNCFKWNWLNRVNQQAELWNEEPQYKMVGLHSFNTILGDECLKNLGAEHWTWTTTPFNIPEILKPLVGKKRYEINL